MQFVNVVFIAITALLASASLGMSAVVITRGNGGECTVMCSAE